MSSFSPSGAVNRELTDRTHLLPDPTAFETPLLSTTITIALDGKDQTSLVRQEGLGGVKGQSGEAVLGQAWKLAEGRVAELRRVLEEEDE